MAAGLARIDWQRPWLGALRAIGEPLAADARLPGSSVHAALNRQIRGLGYALPCAPVDGAAIPSGYGFDEAISLLNVPGVQRQFPVRFVPQHALPAGTAYEQFVFEQRASPVREGLHDFFNGLCWLHFPLAKARLNQLQAQQIARDGVRGQRGTVRDALTLFDENALLLHAPEALWESLVSKDWGRVFGPLRPLWQQARLTVFGHALLEKLVTPRKEITAHVFRVREAASSSATLDAWLAAELTADTLASKPFAHLPVLGVPGWWAANELPEFYEDKTVFRAPRQRP